MEIKKLTEKELKMNFGGGLLAYRIGQAIRLAFSSPLTNPTGYAEWTADVVANEILMDS